LLEKETRINFFKSVSDWLKKIFRANNSNKKEIHKESTKNLNNYANEHISEDVVEKARNYISS
jgi:hypothetical protein